MALFGMLSFARTRLQTPPLVLAQVLRFGNANQGVL